MASRVKMTFTSDMPEEHLHSLLGQFSEDALGEERAHEMDVLIQPENIPPEDRGPVIENRFSNFNEKERALLSLALTTLVMLEHSGALPGSDDPAKSLDMIASCTELVNEITVSMGLKGIDPRLIDTMNALRDQEG